MEKERGIKKRAAHLSVLRQGLLPLFPLSDAGEDSFSVPPVRGTQQRFAGGGEGWGGVSTSRRLGVS